MTSSVSLGVCGSVCSQLWPIPASVTNDNVAAAAAAASVVMLPYSLFFYSFFSISFFPTVAYPADIYAASKLCREGRAGQGRGRRSTGVPAPPAKCALCLVPF